MIKKNILAVIPARGGSKGIHKKNLMNIAGRPLIWWSIQACKSSNLIGKFVVSTEDDKIAEYAESNGAEVLRRPIKLSEDDSTTIDVLKHVISEIDTDVLVLLQPTSPIRFNGLLDRVVEAHIKNDADTTSTGHMCRFYEWGTKPNTTRQVDPGYFYDDGNIYVMSPEDIKLNSWAGKKLCYYPVKSFYHPEIDDIYEAWIIEDTIKRFVKKYGEEIRTMKAITNFRD